MCSHFFADSPPYLAIVFRSRNKKQLPTQEITETVSVLSETDL